MSLTANEEAPLHPSLTLLQIGHKQEAANQTNKEKRAALSRLDTAAESALAALSPDEQEAWIQLTGLPDVLLPVPVDGADELFPTLMRPEAFLWEEAPQGYLSYDPLHFYAKPYAQLSKSQLQRHIEDVTAQYVSAARIHAEPREHWLQQIRRAFDDHPFTRLAREKQHVVQAVETLNRSSLLSVLKEPEDVAYWRHRVEIVLRPYRMIPPDWRWDMCRHDKQLTIDGRMLRCTCADCGFYVQYDPDEDHLFLPEEVLMPRAVKRIATIERQFNEMAVRTPKVIRQLQGLQQIERRLAQETDRIRRLLQMQDDLGEHAPSFPVLHTARLLEAAVLPETDVEPELHSLAAVDLPDIALLRHADADWLDEDVSRLLSDAETALKAALDAAAPRPDDVVFQRAGWELLRADQERIEAYLLTTEQPVTFHMLVRMLYGRPTNKLRRFHLHEAPIFGLLADWPEKHIHRAVKAVIDVHGLQEE
ncbi:RQC-minor-2 family DNA-binding protein [Alkalicoccus chagannorensis]|uniref:RQC-minor-2 family DNA-binding protein n=1 Tax=Alkalicoccus chagannorensis TaxID=427072 RepID=UPI00068453AF|nr:RQC-minor-2 family DNA-binding protein [Alkalicoccus chagannorensis]